MPYELTFEIFFFNYLEKDATLSNERMKTAATSATITVSDICDRTVFPHTSYYILVQNGKYNIYIYIYIKRDSCLKNTTILTRKRQL